MKAKRKYEKGGVVTKEMEDAQFYKSKNELNEQASEIASMLKKGYKEVNGFPRPLSAAQKKSLESEMKRLQKKLSTKPSYRYVGTKIPDTKE